MFRSKYVSNNLLVAGTRWAGHGIRFINGIFQCVGCGGFIGGISVVPVQIVAGRGFGLVGIGRIVTGNNSWCISFMQIART